MILAGNLLVAAMLGADPKLFSDEFDLWADGCPDSSIRLRTSDIRYPNSGNSLRYDADLTFYDNVWGHATNSDFEIPWPGGAGYVPVMLDFGINQFVASAFHVPADFPNDVYGLLVYSSYNSGPSMVLSYSRTCGDFDPPNPNCVTMVGPGESTKKWVIAPYANGCPLTPGTDYFVNLKFADPPPDGCGEEFVCRIGFGNLLGRQ